MIDTHQKEIEILLKRIEDLERDNELTNDKIYRIFDYYGQFTNIAIDNLLIDFILKNIIL